MPIIPLAPLSKPQTIEQIIMIKPDGSIDIDETILWRLVIFEYIPRSGPRPCQ